jgi:exoribonuclease R
MRPNNKRAQEEKAAEEARRMSGDGQFNEHKETPRIVWFKPSDKRVPLIAIPIEQVPENFVTDSEDYQQRLFVVSYRMPDFYNDEQKRYKYLFLFFLNQGSIKRWPITSLHPFGVLERQIGLVSDITVQTQALLADNNVTDSEFSEAVMNCLPELPWTPEESDLEDRREFKDIRIFTIEEQKQGMITHVV